MLDPRAIGRPKPYLKLAGIGFWQHVPADMGDHQPGAAEADDNIESDNRHAKRYQPIGKLQEPLPEFVETRFLPALTRSVLQGLLLRFSHMCLAFSRQTRSLEFFLVR